MKKLYTFITTLFLVTTLVAQSPQSFNYQAVVRDGSGSEIASTTVGLQISILQGNVTGLPVYMETFTPSTNALGLISVEIGNGTVVSGDFETINWGDGPYFIKSEVDPAGGNSYTDLGAAPLMSVPYALQAVNAETAGTAVSAQTALSAETAVSAETASAALTAVSAESAISAQTAVSAESAISAQTAVSAQTAEFAIASQTAESAIYADSAQYADLAGYAETAGNAFDGDYNSLINTPDWNDTIAMRLDSALFLTDTAVAGNLITYDGMNWIAKDIRLAPTGGGQPISNIQPYLTVNYSIALVGIFPSRSWDPFIGTIGIFGFNFAPRGWATCDGQLLAISQNSALFSLLGTTYGGDGRTTFGLPDLRGRAPISQGRGPGLSDYRIGARGGSEQIYINVNNLPSHTHTIIFE